uniref:Uncharacterized protein n=1 Tax=Thermomicrobium roseum TaxID=500 RepID=A0A7C5VXL1_THERO
MTPWIDERLAGLRRQDFESAAAAHRRAAALPPSPRNWRLRFGKIIVRLGTWVSDQPDPLA